MQYDQFAETESLYVHNSLIECVNHQQLSLIYYDSFFGLPMPVEQATKPNKRCIRFEIYFSAYSLPSIFSYGLNNTRTRPKREEFVLIDSESCARTISHEGSESSIIDSPLIVESHTSDKESANSGT